MGGVLMALFGDSLIRGAVRGAAGLALAVLVAMAFAVAAVLSLAYAAIGGTVPSGSGQAAARPAPGQTVPLPPGATASGVVAVAQQYLGMPYAWGGAHPSTSFDCSGLVQWSYGQVGVRLPRTAQMQFDATARVPTEQLQPGDLVFFQICCQPPDTVTHVGIYVGGGQMLHAPTEGQVVRVESIDTPFWRGHFTGAGRPVSPRGGGR